MFRTVLFSALVLAAASAAGISRPVINIAAADDGSDVDGNLYPVAGSANTGLKLAAILRALFPFAKIGANARVSLMDGVKSTSHGLPDIESTLEEIQPGYELSLPNPHEVTSSGAGSAVVPTPNTDSLLTEPPNSDVVVSV